MVRRHSSSAAAVGGALLLALFLRDAMKIVCAVMVTVSFEARPNSAIRWASALRRGRAAPLEELRLDGAARAAAHALQVEQAHERRRRRHANRERTWRPSWAPRRGRIRSGLQRIAADRPRERSPYAASREQVAASATAPCDRQAPCRPRLHCHIGARRRGGRRSLEQRGRRHRAFPAAELLVEVVGWPSRGRHPMRRSPG